jgi:hypothetical protein
MKQLILTACLYLFSLSAYSQDSTSGSKLQAGIQWSTTPYLSVNSNDTVYSNSMVLAPFIRYYYQGFGLKYAPCFITSGSKPGIYMQTVTAGYEQYEREHFNLDLSYTHFFFSGNPVIPYTPLNNELYGFISFKKLWLAPLVSADLGFGKDESGQEQAGLNAAAGVTHSFTSNGTHLFSSVEIDPSLLVNGSANDFYSFLTSSKYITHNKNYGNYIKSNGRGRRQVGGGSTGTVPTTQASSPFSWSNMELNVYSDLTAHHFEIIPVASLYFPLEKSLPVSGYWELKLAYDF